MTIVPVGPHAVRTFPPLAPAERPADHRFAIADEFVPPPVDDEGERWDGLG